MEMCNNLKGVESAYSISKVDTKNNRRNFIAHELLLIDGVENISTEPDDPKYLYIDVKPNKSNLLGILAIMLEYPDYRYEINNTLYV